MPIFQHPQKNYSEMKLVQHAKFSDWDWKEEDIEEILCLNISMIPDNLLLIKNQYKIWENSEHTMDMLCIDHNANPVIIEIKREKDDLQDLQSIRYCNVLQNEITFDRIVDSHHEFLASEYGDRSKVALTNICEFLGKFEENARKLFTQHEIRIILIAPNFSPFLKKSVKKLKEKGQDIRCIEFAPLKLTMKRLRLIEVKELIPETDEYLVRKLPTIIPPLAKTKQTVIDSIIQLNKELPHNKQLQERLGRGKHFCVYITQGKNLFGWSRFVGYQEMTAEKYLTQYKLLTAENTVFSKISGIREIPQKNPQYKRLYGELVNWMKPYSKSPQRSVGIWVLD